MYEKRLIDSILKEYVDELPAILLEGAKAVGKTETCKQLASTEYSMDNAAQRELLQNNPDIILQNSKPVLIDEWQLAPSLWSDVRHAVDDGLPNGSVLFTGSSIRVNSRVHSGAGRIIRLKLRPYSIEERNLSDSYIRIADLFNFDSKATVNDVYYDIQSTFVKLIDAKQRVPVAKLAVKKAKENYELSQGRYSVGVSDAIEYKEAQIQYYDARLSYLNTIYQFNSAKANLERAIGQTLPGVDAKDEEGI